MIRITPPRISDLFPSTFPNFFPIKKPSKHIKKVITEINIVDKIIITSEYSAKVIPIDKASIELAIA